ncbi:MAG: cytochrome c oxidase accessory protein CcoG [Methylobacteriaceae bacterium]|nr:cytochrome c oxidase accessory protein CcoG [Methylobacteriaceae bacterium]
MNAGVKPTARHDNAPVVVETGEGELYVSRRKIYPQSVKGRFRTIKWSLLAFCLAVYYFLPFVRWDRGPHSPDQAVLIDMPSRRFYFFFVEIWPQEVYFITGLLILAALSLFLMNAVAGRIWCGYLCWQTVWTDLFQAIERFTEGDRREHYKADQQPWTANRVARRAAKYFLWLMVAWWTGGAWVLYFADAPTLVKQLLTFQAPAIAYTWIGILTVTTFVFAGLMREQVCVYMCPWPRIQAALTDEHALNVTYRYDRGEPRMSVKKATQLRAANQPAGDCVDCDQCVAVCPTGVDIRKGLQLDCIQCGLCIDACDTVMKKIGRPTGLIAYDTDINVKRRQSGEAETWRLVRPRTLLYAGVIVVVIGVMLSALLLRNDVGVNAMHDRNPIFVKLSDGSVRNAYTVNLLNKKSMPRRFLLRVDNLPGVRVETTGQAGAQDGFPLIDVGPDQTRQMRVLLTMPADAKIPPQTKIQFRLVDTATGKSAAHADHFMAP